MDSEGRIRSYQRASSPSHCHGGVYQAGSGRSGTGSVPRPQSDGAPQNGSGVPEAGSVLRPCLEGRIRPYRPRAQRLQDLHWQGHRARCLRLLSRGSTNPKTAVDRRHSQIRFAKGECRQQLLGPDQGDRGPYRFLGPGPEGAPQAGSDAPTTGSVPRPWSGGAHQVVSATSLSASSPSHCHGQCPGGVYQAGSGRSGTGSVPRP